MSFLQPWMLIALPLIAAPIIIHLVNQRRFQTVPWAAMMFLLQASKMSSGYSKLRQWLILALRTLAVAALILFTARPLASGLLGLLGNRTDEVAIVLVDRSPSMQQTQPGTGMTKQQSALMQLSSTLATLGVKRVAVFDSYSEKPIELETPEDIASNVGLLPNGATSDLPGLMERALVYIKSNQLASTDVWICSDMRESDWKSRDGRWVAAREGFLNLAQDVRFHILDLSSGSDDNLAIRIVNAKRVEEPSGPELSISFKLQRGSSNRSSEKNEGDATAASGPSIQVPVQIEVGSVRSVLPVDLQS
ncbi:MAG: BatA domain-containing protein, partial [Pirellula sp.]